MDLGRWWGAWLWVQCGGVIGEDRDTLLVKHIFTAQGARRDCMVVWWWDEVNERARVRGHA